MRRRVFHPPHPSGRVNVTPMIDVIMVLIVFYLIVGQMAAESKRNMPLPIASSGSRHIASDPLVINVVVQDGLVVIEVDRQTMNADELALLGGGPGDPWARAEGALGEELGLILVTRGDHGAGFVAREGLDPNPMSWRSGRDRNRVGRTLSGSVTLTAPPIVGDPTGCGDVWGATMFARLLHGDDIEAAMRAANELAGLNVQHRGARGLVERFAGSVAQHPKNS